MLQAQFMSKERCVEPEADVSHRRVGAAVRATNEADVARLVSQARELTGEIDVWINNAGVTAFGTLESIPIEDHRRVLETNLWGAVYCARAVVPIFRHQARGVMINIGSILSKVGQPFVPSYVISKFALRGLSEALRAELAGRASPRWVWGCTRCSRAPSRK
jgi:NAD(P)-dependent dehydrogenase (short-subunit alcohol dehydrogenase family)